MIQQISAAQFKAKCLQLMDEVQKYHGEIIVTKHGKPIARLVPIDSKPKKKTLFGYMKGTVVIKGDIVSPNHDVWKTND